MRGVRGFQRHVDDSPGYREPVDLYGHRDGERGDSVEKIHRAVDGIDNPSNSRGIVGVSATFLTQDRICRAQLRQKVANHLFGFGIDHRDGIGGRALRRNRTTLGGTGTHQAEYLGPTQADVFGCAFGDGYGYFPQLCGVQRIGGKVGHRSF